MAANAQAQRIIDRHDASGLSDLRRASLLELSAVMLLLAWLVGLAAISFNGEVRGLWVAGLLAVGSLGVMWLRRRSFQAALALLILSCLSAIVVQEALFPDGPAQFLFPVVVVASSLLVSGFSVFGVATLASLACLGAGGWDQTQLPFTVFLNYLTAFAAWLGARQMRFALEWTQSSYGRANDLLSQLRDERAHLASTLKMLEDAYYRITKLNSALVEARGAAEAARRLKAEFAANISHELRTPLNLIIGFSEMMANAPETYAAVKWTPTLRGDIEQIYRSSRHLSTLIDDILDLSAMEVNQLGLTIETMPVQPVIEEAVGVLRDLYRAKHLYLNIAIEADLPLVRIDPTRIRQVLLNLLTNAIRFTRIGGVTVSARLTPGGLEVGVTDTGIGITEADVPKVFEEFGQVDGSTSRLHEGTGLGVPLSKRLVELHGGRMWLESVPGEGSTFCFTLPVAAEAAQALTVRAEQRSPTAARPAMAHRKGLLVSEPDPLLLRTIRRHLSAYDVVEVEADAALPAQVEQVQPVALVIDQHRPGSVPALSGLPSDLPIISVSLPGNLSTARALGIDNYLIKPVSREQLHEAISALERPPRTVLIVDDDRPLVELLSRMLQSSGENYELLKAYGGAEAVALLRQRPVDLVLLDIAMPRVGGLDVLRVMQQDPRLARTAVIVVSAQYPETAEPEEGLFLQVVRPQCTTTAELLACLRGVLEGLPRRELPGPASLPARPAVLSDPPAS